MLTLLLSLFLSLGLPQPAPVIPGDTSVVLADSLYAYRPLLCPQDTVEVVEVLFAGNKKTRPGVLRAELTILEGTRLSARQVSKVLEENRLRLFNLQLFHWVRHEVWCENGKLRILFLVQERWYVWPVPILDFADRNINAWLDKRDLRRLDYGMHLRHTNFRGRNEQLRINLQHGFNRKFDFHYAKPYLTEKYRRIGGSVTASMYQSRSLEYNTIGNRLAVFRDEGEFPIQRQFLSAAVIHRENVQRQTTLGLSFHRQVISDSAFRLNPHFFNSRTRREYFEVELGRVVNLRNTFSYPLSGSYFQATLRQQVFLNPESAPLSTLHLRLSNYFDLKREFYYSYGVELQTRLGGKPAYADNAALGYKSFARGYELYVVGGQHFSMLKQGFSKKILGIDRITVPLVGSSRFNHIPLSVYFNIFADAAYVVDRHYGGENPLSNRLLVGSGVGLHVVTFYDRVIRLEYSLNRERDRGFFIHADFPF